MRLLHSVLVNDKAVSADGIETFDLPVNPLSVVLLNLRPLNDTGTLSNFQRGMGLCGAINRLTLSYRGGSVYSMSGRDCLALNYWRHGMGMLGGNEDDVDNERRCYTLPILLGRFAYDPQSCFPATRRGEFVMDFDVDIADTGYDGFRYSVETIELLGAEPKEYERKCSLSQTMAATGDQDMQLPIGNDVRGLLLFGTTAFVGASPAPSWGRVSLFLDNQQIGYQATDFEVARTLTSLMGRLPPSGEFHIHEFEPVAGVRTTGPKEQAGGTEGWSNYAFLDLDPTRDDTFTVKTAGANDFHLRSNVETADAVRVIPVERIGL